MTEPPTNEREVLGEYAMPDFAALQKDCLRLIRDAGQDPVAFCRQLGDDFLAAMPHVPVFSAAEQKIGHAVIEKRVNEILSQ